LLHDDRVNVTDVGETIPSLVSEEVKSIETTAVGSVSSWIVNVTSEPPSVVTRPVEGSIVTPAVSSSVLLNSTESPPIIGFQSAMLGQGQLADVSYRA
jgi:hypothetical protein